MGDNLHIDTDEDAPLVAACRRGELEAFERLVRRHQSRMFNIAFRITGGYEDACEVVQDAFVAAYRGIGSFRGEARFATWLTTITANLSRNRFQQLQARRRGEAFSLDDPLPTAEGEIVPDPPSGEPSAEERLERRQLLERLEECIRALGGEFREVLVLRDVEEFSYEEVGAILGVREGTLKSRLFRARETVRECVKRAMGGI